MCPHATKYVSACYQMRVRMLTEAEGGQDAKVEMLKRCEEVIQQQQARPFKKKKMKKK